MPFLIGTDEAGYGPNLGPLTVTGTLWQVPDVEVDLYESLQSVVAPESTRRRAGSIHKLQVADSKTVYPASKSIESLENSVLSFLFSIRGSIPADQRDLLTGLFSRCIEDRVALLAGEHTLWNDDSVDLPLKCQTDQLRESGAQLAAAYGAANVELVDLQCRPVFPAAFNRSVETLGNKANLLSSQTMLVISNLLAATKNEDVTIYCDKHGGRSHYLPLIQQHLSDQPVTVEVESRAVSRYRWVHSGKKIAIQFAAKGESQLPVALASMVSKYVREVFMHAWNQFWADHVKDLKPTKGYPVDAKRFMADIDVKMGKMGTSKPQIWRAR